MRRIIFFLLRWTGIPFLLRELVHRNKVTVLCYHDPSPEIGNIHFKALRRAYNIISLREYVKMRRGEPHYRLPPKPLIITIDDGHRGNHRLKRLFLNHRIPATIFLCSSIVTTSRHYWWTALPDDARIEYLKSVQDETRLRLLSDIGFIEYGEYEQRQALSSDEISDLKTVVDFQSHSRLHPVLPRCSSKRVEDEILGSKNELEKGHGLDIYAFAFPNGDYSEREIDIVKKSGYQCALTLDGGVNSSDTDLFRLTRLPVYDYADVNELIVKASGLWDLIERRFRPRSYGYVAFNSTCKD